jgi:replication initiation protein RepC
MTSPNPSGWRKQSPERAKFAQIADKAPIGRHTRNEIRAAWERAVPALRINPTQARLMQELMARTFDQDWSEGARPIVWRSNSDLADRLCVSVSTVRHAMASLTDLGWLTHVDSSNCRRTGHRDKHNRIIYAFGIDLSILEARYEELVARAEEHEAKRVRRQTMERNVTKQRRQISAIIDMARSRGTPGRWQTFERRLDKIRALLGSMSKASDRRLMRIYTALNMLAHAVQKAFISAVEAKNVDAKPSENECALETTTDHASVYRSEEMHRANARSVSLPPDAGSAGEWALENEPVAGTTAEASSKTVPPGSLVDLRTILVACPVLQEFTHQPLRSWGDLDRAAGEIRPGLGISADAWAEARSILGGKMAAAALAVVAQKHGAGLIDRPGGYLRGITRAAEMGRLRLDRSIRALYAKKLSDDDLPSRPKKEDAAEMPVPQAEKLAVSRELLNSPVFKTT